MARLARWMIGLGGLAGSWAIATVAYADSPLTAAAVTGTLHLMPASNLPASNLPANSTTTLIFPGFRDLLESRDQTDTYGRNYRYLIHQPKGSVEGVVEQDGDRILMVNRSPIRGRQLKKKGQVVAAYQVIGLPSRVFPGLVGLQQIPPETVQPGLFTSPPETRD